MLFPWHQPIQIPTSLSDKKVWERFGGHWIYILDMSKVFFQKKTVENKKNEKPKPWTNRGQTVERPIRIVERPIGIVERPIGAVDTPPPLTVTICTFN